MSLKSFHIFFIVVSTLATFGFGIWSLLESGRTGQTSDIVLGVISLAASVSLVIYGLRFFKKLKQIG